MKLTCHEAQKMISQYLDDALTDRECESFLEHVENCPRCYHELETEFIISYALKYLDAAADASYNLTGLLEDKIRRSERTLTERKVARFLFFLLTGIVLLIAVLFLLHYLFPGTIDPIYYITSFWKWLSSHI